MVNDSASAVQVRSDWRGALTALSQPRVVTMFFLGLSAGLPLLLIFSSLSLWLREAGVERAAVTYFSWAALGYSFKFIWAPLIDRLPVPFLTNWFGRRRAWMLVAQLSIMLAIIGMALTDPQAGSYQLTYMAIAAVMLGFSSATQDIVIDAYRIESAGQDLQALMSSTYIAGYRVGMLLAGAGALYLASYFGSDNGAYSYAAWRLTYVCMAALMLVGVITVLIIREPLGQIAQTTARSNKDYLGFMALFAVVVTIFMVIFFQVGRSLIPFQSAAANVLGSPVIAAASLEGIRLMVSLAAAVGAATLMLRSKLVNRALVLELYVEPVREFFRRYGTNVALLLLMLVGMYRISDIVLGVIANVFYQDLGFSKVQIATVVKTFGLGMTLIGGFLGGLMALRYGVVKILFLGALLTVVTNLCFIALAVVGNDERLLYWVISADNLTAGLASAAFIAFLSSLTNIKFTAVQYAIFSSLMTLLPKVLGGYSGTVVDQFGYINFFVVAAVLGLPVLVLVWLVGRRVQLALPSD